RPVQASLRGLLPRSEGRGAVSGVLARLPATRDGGNPPLEKYALGIWNAHFWDKETCYFCRHGDYTGQDDQGRRPGEFA
ncbi:MAG: hypothetical protein QF437_23230, partial [Planctomycetota bacterium]|nr:hypothetical protein [Planctomycetota bacterium]